jgi:hypothetical protein
MALLCLEVSQQSSEGYLILVVFFLANEITDVSHTANVSSPCLGSVHHGFPVADGL